MTDPAAVSAAQPEAQERRYRILKYPWHTAHDYELAKMPHDFFFLASTHREWATSQRPVPPSVTWVDSVDTEPTDVMILHLDQWAFQEPAKRFLYLQYRDAYPGPKVVINHGSNMADGMSSDVLSDLLDGAFMVCNSESARQLWDYPRSRYVRHGMSVDEWPMTNYGNHNIVVIQPHSTLHAATRNLDTIALVERYLPIVWIGRDKRFRNFEQYRHYLGTSSIYFNPSYASANPRARTEAMLSGLAVVTTNANGESEYIENGVNGFASNDPAELVEYLVALYEDPDLVRRIGAAGRETARDCFNYAQFVDQWNDVLDLVTSE